MENPENKAMRSVIYEWQESIINKDKIDQAFLKDALLAVVEGLLSLDSRISDLASQEWRGAREIYELRDELNLQRYKMINLTKEIEHV